MRKSLEDTWRYLESEHADVPRHPDGRPLIRDRMPSIYDEEPLGFSYFRSGLEDADRSHLTMPRTLFSRSWLVRTSFAGTDLSESCMCWNDFDECDFSGADLSGCDMRASHFRGCKFVGAVLRGADLRRSSFKACDFAGADVAGAVAEDEDFDGCVHDFLSPEQQARSPGLSWPSNGFRSLPSSLADASPHRGGDVMPGMAAKVIITERQQDVLQALVWSRSCPQGLAHRAEIILLAFAGYRNEEIADRLNCERHGVGLWRKRWQKAFSRLVVIECVENPAALREAIEEVLSDLPRAGCGGKFTAEQIARVLAVACEPPENSGRPVTHWTPRELADEVIKRGIVPTISARHVGRFLEDGRVEAAPDPVLAECGPQG